MACRLVMMLQLECYSHFKPHGGLTKAIVCALNVVDIDSSSQRLVKFSRISFFQNGGPTVYILIIVLPFFDSIRKVGLLYSY